VAAPSPAGGASSGQGQTLGNGGFQECSGLQLEAQVREYAEGGRNDGVARGAGRATLSPIVLKRGMFVADTAGAAALWDWLQGMVTGRLPVVRYDGTVEVFGPQEARADQRRRVVARWTFDAGLPIKVMGPVLNAKTGEIAVEELHIVHEALRLEVSSS
jgi:phage tail-like protein